MDNISPSHTHTKSNPKTYWLPVDYVSIKIKSDRGLWLVHTADMDETKLSWEAYIVVDM